MKNEQTITIGGIPHKKQMVVDGWLFQKAKLRVIEKIVKLNDLYILHEMEDKHDSHFPEEIR